MYGGGCIIVDVIGCGIFVSIGFSFVSVGDDKCLCI